MNVLYPPYVQPEFVPQDPEVEVDGHRELLVVYPQHVQNLGRAISDLAVLDLASSHQYLHVHFDVGDVGGIRSR